MRLRQLGQGSHVKAQGFKDRLEPGGCAELFSGLMYTGGILEVRGSIG